MLETIISANPIIHLNYENLHQYKRTARETHSSNELAVETLRTTKQTPSELNLVLQNADGALEWDLQAARVADRPMLVSLTSNRRLMSSP